MRAYYLRSRMSDCPSLRAVTVAAHRTHRSLLATRGRWCRYKPLVSALLQKVAEVHRIVSIARAGLSAQILASGQRLRDCHGVFKVSCPKPFPPVWAAVRYWLNTK